MSSKELYYVPTVAEAIKGENINQVITSLNHYHVGTFRSVLMTTHDVNVQSDLIQAMLVKVWQYLEKYPWKLSAKGSAERKTLHTEFRLVGFCKKVLRNERTDLYRQEKAESDDHFFERYCHFHGRSSQSAEEIMTREEENEKLRSLLNKELSQQEQLAVHEWLDNDRCHREIAKMLGITVVQSRKLRSKIVSKLRMMLPN